jgi:RHS repeat-associated protein
LEAVFLALAPGSPAIPAADGSFSGTAPVITGTNTVAIAATDVSGNTATKSYQVSVGGSSATLTYDANGNLTSDGTRTLTWDAENRLISVTIGAHTSTFTYDGLDRRVRIAEADNGSTTSDTRFVWCGLAICEARDNSGTTVTKRYFAQGVQDNGTALFYTRDHLGSLRELTDTAGLVRARYDYDPWGRRIKISGDQEADVGFTGHSHHGPSGLVLTPFRVYDANVGRWTSDDPIGLAGGVNLYGYVGNRATAANDPLGLCPFGIDRKEIAAEVYAEKTRASYDEYMAMISVILNRVDSEDKQFVDRGGDFTVHNVLTAHTRNGDSQFQAYGTDLYQRFLTDDPRVDPRTRLKIEAAVNAVFADGPNTDALFFQHVSNPTALGKVKPASPAVVGGTYLWIPTSR